MKVLLVEDDAAIRELIVAILQRGGHQVKAVADGDKAFRAYKNRKSPFDLVLTDRDHLGIDGIELAAKIRRINPSQCIAFQTANSTDPIVEDRFKMYGVGDIPRIEKPFRVEQFLQFIQSAVSNTAKGQ